MRAVMLEPRGDGYEVANHWQSGEMASGNLSESLAQALRKVGADEACRVIVGGPDSAVATHDLRVPRLSGETMRNALLFELRKICPLPSDQLAWGYRVIPGTAAGTMQTVRLFYLRDAEWSRWVENVSRLTRSVDLLCSCRMALDPAFGDSYVRLDEDVLLPPLVDGMRSEGATVEEGAPVLGGAGNPLGHPRLNAGTLDQLDHDEAQLFIPAILLAAYGIAGDISRDRRTLPPLPDELIPKRNRISRAIAMALVVYVAMVGLTWGGIALKRGMEYRRELSASVRSAEEMIAKFEQTRDSSETEKNIRESLGQIAVNEPGMSAVLAELTDSVPANFWITKLTWTAGKVELDLKGSETDLGFVGELENSPLLREVELTDRKVDQAGNLISAQVRMLAEEQSKEQAPEADR